ncbi:MAG: hypothetical protein ISQ88_11740 [Rhodobacteraceae bacterium]|nr:hypothetical protein [Paracoccaceae bacterium]
MIGMRFAGQAINGANYVGAAQNAGGDISAALAKTAPNWGTSSKMGMKNSAEESMAGMQASADVATAGITGAALAQQGALQAESIKAQGAAAASATQSQGLSGMFGTLAGGVVTGFNKGWKDASSIGFKGNQVNDHGRIRY